MYYNSLADEWHVYLIVSDTDNNDTNNDPNYEGSCIDNTTISYDDYCISYIDYEYMFKYETGTINNLQCIIESTTSSDPISRLDRWHLNNLDGDVDGTYEHVDTYS